jgi:hypothetical protein
MIPVGDGVLYNSSPVPNLPPFDKLVHAFGFGASTLVTGRVLRSRVGPSSRTAAAIVAALGGLGVGALVEVFEFSMTRIYEETNIGGYTDTGWDLVANLGGRGRGGLLVRNAWRAAQVSLSPSAPSWPSFGD